MPGYYNPYYQPVQPMPFMASQPQHPQQIQNGGFIPVRSENEARNYPVAPGNSVTFKDESAPYVYTKTMGFSQLDRPIFEKFKLVKEDAEPEPMNIEIKEPDYAKDIQEMKEEINDLKGQIDALKRKEAKHEYTE